MEDIIMNNYLIHLHFRSKKLSRHEINKTIKIIKKKIKHKTGKLPLLKIFQQTYLLLLLNYPK